MPKKKSVKKKAVKEEVRVKKTFDVTTLVIGLIVGVVIAAVVSLMIFIPLSNERYEESCVAGEDKVPFDVEDTHLSLRDDFSTGTPVYDGAYCKKKYEEKFGKQSTSCVLSGVDTHSRINPMVVNVGCLCEGA